MRRNFLVRLVNRNFLVRLANRNFDRHLDRVADQAKYQDAIQSGRVAYYTTNSSTDNSTKVEEGLGNNVDSTALDDSNIDNTYKPMDDRDVKDEKNSKAVSFAFVATAWDGCFRLVDPTHEVLVWHRTRDHYKIFSLPIEYANQSDTTPNNIDIKKKDQQYLIAKLIENGTILPPSCVGDLGQTFPKQLADWHHAAANDYWDKMA